MSESRVVITSRDFRCCEIYINGAKGPEDIGYGSVTSVAPCMPFDEYEWIDKKEILTFEEITRLASLFVQFGVDKIRLTGGEPLLRRDLERLISKLSSLSGLKDLCLTTNGSLLAEKVSALQFAGLKRVNVSLDTLNPEKFARIRRRGDLAKVLGGLFAAKRCGLHPIKINAVIERGVNDDDIIDLGVLHYTGFALPLSST